MNSNFIKEFGILASKADETTKLLVNRLEDLVENIESKLDLDEIGNEFEIIMEKFPILSSYLENYKIILSYGEKSRLLYIEELVTLLKLKQTTPSFLYSISVVKDVLVDFYFNELKKIRGLKVENYDNHQLIKTLSNLEEYNQALSKNQYNELYSKLLIAIQSTRPNFEETLIQGTVAKGTFVRSESLYYVLKVGTKEVYLPKKRKLIQDDLQEGNIFYVYVTEINNDKNMERIFVSRTHPALLNFLLHERLPLIKSRVINILGIVRNNGEIAKVIVDTDNMTIDPVVICKDYIHSLNLEIPGEKIDFVRWSNDKFEYIQNLFFPIKIIRIEEEKDKIHVVVSSNVNDELIGKNSINLKLIKSLLNTEIVFEKELSQEELESWNRLL